MSFYKVLIGFGVTASFLLIILPFLNLPVLSTDTTFIASYGAYLSGTIAPLISALAFLALLKTLYIQQEQLKQSNTESQKTSLQIVLSKLEEKLDQDLMRHDINFKFKDRDYKFRDILSLEFFSVFYKSHLPKKSHDCESKNEWQAVMCKEMMQLADVNLLRLASIVKRYDRLCSENTMYQYYSSKYFVLISRLDSLGYLNEDNRKFWKQV
ncbi:hypothetical protein ACYJ3L_000326 [Vibrio alginolyticus]|uniref:hypothetical protein n=1 Tax=Vibrio alginolyticus TaxID=663 RepID=UPI002FE673E9